MDNCTSILIISRCTFISKSYIQAYNCMFYAQVGYIKCICIYIRLIYSVLTVKEKISC